MQNGQKAFMPGSINGKLCYYGNTFPFPSWEGAVTAFTCFKTSEVDRLFSKAWLKQPDSCKRCVFIFSQQLAYLLKDGWIWAHFISCHHLVHIPRRRYLQGTCQGTEDAATKEIFISRDWENDCVKHALWKCFLASLGMDREFWHKAPVKPGFCPCISSEVPGVFHL